MDDKKNKLMWLSDSPFTVTGYSTISMNIMNGLAKDYEIHYNAHNYVGQPLPPGITLKDGTRFDFWLHGAGREQYCKDLLLPRINKYQPRVFGILLDTFMLYPWLLDMNFSPAKTLFYFPSDGGGGMPQGCENILKKVNHGVCMSRFGKKQLKEVHDVNVSYIPHAVDTSIYYPMSPEEKVIAREEFSVLSITGAKMKGFLKDKFVVGVVARNQGRKMLDRTVKAFKKFCVDKPDAVLFFHSDLYDSAAVFDLRQIISRLGLQNRVVFSDVKFFEGFDYKDMNKVYNVMDVFFLSTSGEGFGVPIIEAAATGVPSVVTDYTTTHELLVEDGVCGEPIKLVGTEKDFSVMMGDKMNTKDVDNALLNGTITGSWAVERGLCCIDDAALKLDKLYKNPELRKTYGLVGRQKVLKFYDWKVVIKQWKNLIDRMCET